MICRGMSRTVLLLGSVAIKVPSLRNGPIFWLYGALGNALESERWQQTRHPSLGYVYWCAPFGLFLIMKRYQMLDRLLTRQEVHLEIDNNGCNVGVEDGRPVLIDYGNPSWYVIVEGVTV